MNYFPGSMKTIAVLILFLLFSGCGVKQPERVAQDDVSPLSCMVLLPVRVPYNNSGIESAATADLQDGAIFMQEVLQEELGKSQVSRIVETSQLRYGTEEIDGGNYGAIRKISEHAQCDTVLLSTLSRYTRRQGGEYAVDIPASAAFEMKIVDTGSGKTLWMASFNETQESLLSNIFSFTKAQQRGFKWITVEELVTRGVQDKLRKCPYIY